jgi:sensor histidine kinase YesM
MARLAEEGGPAGPEFLPGYALGPAVRLTLGYYIAAYLIFIWATTMLGQLSWRTSVGVAVPMMIVDGTLAFSLVLLMRLTLPLTGTERWIILALGLAAVAALQSSWDTNLRLWTGELDRAAYPRVYDAFIRAYTLNVFHTGLYTALIAFHAAYVQVAEQKRLLVLAQASERQAHLAALRFQLNPHFLFNAMNALSGLVVLKRNAEAEAMIERLAVFLRGVLAADPAQQVTLEDEFDMLEAYLDIERMRFGDRLDMAIELPPDLAPLRVPPFLLQPLVENAMKYGVARTRDPVRVRICAGRSDGDLVLTVQDDAPAELPPDALPGSAGLGVGLSNVRHRLLLEFGQAATLATEKLRPGFRACVRIQLSRLQAA